MSDITFTSLGGAGTVIGSKHLIEYGGPDLSPDNGRQPVLIDDIASSGRTLVAAAQELQARGFAPPVCPEVHPLFAGDAFEQVSKVTRRIVSTDGPPHVSNEIRLAALFATALGA